LSEPYLMSASWILPVVVQAVAGSNPVAHPSRSAAPDAIRHRRRSRVA
jgi:hypothetical protein